MMHGTGVSSALAKHFWSKWLLPLFSLLVGGALLGCSTEEVQQGAGSESSTLEMATFSQGSSWYIYGATMAELLREEAEGLQAVDVLPYAGGLGNIEVISGGEADLGFSFSVVNRWAAEGSVAFEEKYDNLHLLVGGLDEYYVGIIMRDEFMERHGITSIADIKENEAPVRLYTMNVGSQGEFLARQVLDVHGMDYDQLEAFGGSITHTSFDVVQSAFQDGQADMFIQMMTKGHPSFTEIALQTPVTFMSIADEYAQQMGEFGSQQVVFPAGVFEGQEEEIETVGFATTLVAHEQLAEDMAYEVTKTLVENAQRLQNGHQALEDFDPQQGIEPEMRGEIDLHPGAEKYYQEKGWIE